jgi:hypothetical protein
VRLPSQKLRLSCGTLPQPRGYQRTAHEAPRPCLARPQPVEPPSYPHNAYTKGIVWVLCGLCVWSATFRGGTVGARKGKNQ